MDSKSQIEIQKKLVEEIQKTMDRINEYKNMSQPITPDDAIGRVSRMDAINNKSVVEAALHKAEEKLKKLKIVESEINNSDFGVCIRCKRPIPIARLLIVPESRKCVNCA